MKYPYTPDSPLILASCSPRRREILSQMGLSFECADPDIGDERSYLDTSDLENSLRTLASAKAKSVAGKNPRALVLGADTIVVKEGEIFGKPGNKENAFKMLKKLSGSDHLVITAVSLECLEEQFSLSVAEKTRVVFRDLSDEEIEAYLTSEEYRDKAGAYAIQGKAMVFIKRIEGCYYNVVGLPVTATLELIKRFIARKESLDVR
ncbi:Septum formation protein Maf [Chitinispirillum alkaliphilum]|nr:Septum formation protein Maf [Chitinispirillum alkaliphilum]